MLSNKLLTIPLVCKQHAAEWSRVVQVWKPYLAPEHCSCVILLCQKLLTANIEHLTSWDGHALLFYSPSEWTQIKTFMETGLPHCASVHFRWCKEWFLMSVGGGVALLWTLILPAYQWSWDGAWSPGCVEPWSQIYERKLGGSVAEGAVQIHIGGTCMLNSFNISSVDLYILWI